jgi:hypothetical protein
MAIASENRKSASKRLKAHHAHQNGGSLEHFQFRCSVCVELAGVGGKEERRSGLEAYPLRSDDAADDPGQVNPEGVAQGDEDATAELKLL